MSQRYSTRFLLVILDASHKKWILACTVLAAAASGVYALDAWRLHPVGPSGGSVLGLWLGIVGTLLLGFAGLLPLRKWYPLARIGSAQSWLRAHIWLSLLGSFLILLHSAFQWRGTLEQVLMLLLAGLVVSGVWGLLAQHLLTRQLTLQVPLETFYENIPQICRMLQFEGDVLIARECEAPLELKPDLAIATDERLKNRGVLGRDFDARLAKVYKSGNSAADNKPANSATTEPATAPMTKKVLPAKDAPVASATVADGLPAAAPQATPAAEAAPAARPLSAAEKIALMRAKKASPEPAAPPPDTAAAPAVEAVPAARPLSAAEKIALMRAKKASPETAAPPAPVEVAAAAVSPEAGPLSTKDKLALMRAGKKPAPTAEAAPPAPAKEAAAPSPAPITAPRLTVAARTIEPVLLQPFREDLRTFFLQRVRPFLSGECREATPGLGTDTAATIVFARMFAALPQELHETLAALASLCDQRRQLAKQLRLHYWLHGWLVLVHIPAATALLALVLAHIAASLYW